MLNQPRSTVERLILFSAAGAAIGLLLFSASVWLGAFASAGQGPLIFPLVAMGYVAKGAAIAFIIAVGTAPRPRQPAHVAVHARPRTSR